MTRFGWEGRARHGASVRGVIEADTKDAAIARVQGQGVLVSKIEATGDAETDAAPVAMPAGVVAPGRRRDGESWRDKHFYIGVAALFLAFGVGTAYVAPVLVYDCRRDAGGNTGCIIQRRMYGFVPLSDVRLTNLASVDIASEHVRPMNGNTRDQPTAQDSLILVSKDGGRWQSHPSSWPFGSSNGELSSGIRSLLSASGPGEFHAWIAEGVPTLAAVSFLAPTGMILLALLVRLVVPRALIEAKTAELERLANRRSRLERR